MTPGSEASPPTPTVCHNCERERAWLGTRLVSAVVKSKRKQWWLCDDCYANSFIIQRPDLYDGDEFAWYTPQLYQRPYHACTIPNFLTYGTRGTGKSLMMRRDAILRCIKHAGYKVLILRRKMPDLKKSHLRFIKNEMAQLGEKEIGYYRETSTDVVFHNGSFIQFSHCETLKDIENYLGSEWDLIIFDEISTFPLEMFLTICAASRTVEDEDYVALVRCGSNPMGIGAQWMKEWFIDKTVSLADYPDYDPTDFGFEFTMLDQNRYIAKEAYKKKLGNLPEQQREAWLYGRFVIEGAYFKDFKKTKMVEWRGQKVERPWHCIQTMPYVFDKKSGGRIPIQQTGWANITRSIDWGWSPDPAVCHWHVVMSNKRKITFMELTKREMVAADFAKLVVSMSAGMHVVETDCDPDMFTNTGETKYSIGEIFELNGVPLTPSHNRRELYGYAIHDMLNTLITENVGDQVVEYPSWQILEYACPELVRTIPILQMNSTDTRKLADGPDHWVVSCAYFGMGGAPASTDPDRPVIRRYMRKGKQRSRQMIT